MAIWKCYNNNWKFVHIIDVLLHGNFSQWKENCMNRRKFSLFNKYIFLFFCCLLFAPYFCWCSTKSADYGFFPFYSIAANQAWARAHQKKKKKEYNQILFWRMRFFFLYLFHKAYSRNCKDLSSQFPLKNSYSSENSWVFYACIGESSIFSWINFPSTVSSNSNVGKAVVHAIFNKGRVLFWLDVEIRMLLFRSNHFAWYILHDRKCSWKIVSHQYHYYQPTLTHTIT